MIEEILKNLPNDPVFGIVLACGIFGCIGLFAFFTSFVFEALFDPEIRKQVKWTKWQKYGMFLIVVIVFMMVLEIVFPMLNNNYYNVPVVIIGSIGAMLLFSNYLEDIEVWI